MKIQNLKNRIIYILILTLLLGIVFFNTKKESIIIGFSAQLTGKQAELGVQQRNGVQLAVENINASGGINNRQIKLMVKDDFGIPDKAKEAAEILIKEGVVAIIGHATSRQTLEAVKVANENKVVMISPTSSTPLLSGIEDYFFRVYPANDQSCQALAEYMRNEENIGKVSIVFDSDNEAYSKPYSSMLSEKFQGLGGEVAAEISFSSSTQSDFNDLAIKLRSTNAAGVVIIASDVDTAVIAQKIRNIGWEVPLFTSDWAQTESLISNGGRAVEGMKLEQSYIFNNESREFIEFKEQYRKRFGIEPSFGAAFSYEATLVLAEALKRTGGKAEKLNEKLKEIKDFQGVINEFSLDINGDAKRPSYIGGISNGKFITYHKLSIN
ncbi:MAG: ABC transporter substrate-binding protein [Clostridiaceae bacterium]